MMCFGANPVTFGMLIMSGKDDLGFQGQDPFTQDVHDSTGSWQVAPAAIKDVAIPVEPDVAGEKHPLARQIQHIDDGIETVPRSEDRLDVEAVEGELRGVSGTADGNQRIVGVV
jgi:hypothetical protein